MTDVELVPSTIELLLEQLIFVPEVSELTGLSYRQVQRIASQGDAGKLPGARRVKIGPVGFWVWCRQDVMPYVEDAKKCER